MNIPNLPTIDVLEGRTLIMDIAEPCWLYAGRITELDGDGHSWRFTYRSPEVRPSDPIYRRMLDFLGGALSLGEPETISDPGMMFGEAVLTLYEPRPMDMTA